MSAEWPVAELNNVRRLRALAEATGATYVEDVVPAPYDTVWAVVSDLETGLPALLPDVRSVRITARAGDRLEMKARGVLGLRGTFELVLRPGWCVMRNSRIVGGMAAVPEAGGTRFALMGALTLPGSRLTRPILRPLTRRFSRAAITRLRAQVGHNR